MRSYWSGTMTVGLLAIPVKLYGATKSHDSKFKKVHKTCLTPVKQVLHCEHCESDIPFSDTTRGHEVVKGQFVEITDADLENLPLPSSGSIVLDGFADAKILPNLQREKTVYIGPDK